MKKQEEGESIEIESKESKVSILLKLLQLKCQKLVLK